MADPIQPTGRTGSPFLHVEVQLTEAAMAEAFLSALTNRFLPERFFYWSPLSVRAWLALCRDGPYRNFVRSDSLVRASVKPVVQALSSGPIEVISLGAGQGTKDLHLLTALLPPLAKGHRAVTYVPVDASQTLLELACANALKAGVPCQGIKADLADPAHLAALAPRKDGPLRLWLLLGNTLGGFDPPDMLRQLRALLRNDDLLLVDGELHNDAGTKSGYDNELNRAFAMGPLRSIGVKDADGDLVFEPRADLAPGLHRLGKYFQTKVDMTVMVGGEPVTFKAGERIEMNHSGKYSRSAFFSLLDSCGLNPAGEWLSEDGRFLMVLARPGSLPPGG